MSGPGEPSASYPRALRQAAGVAAVFVAAALLWVALFALRGERLPDAFDVARWEVATLPNKWLFALGGPLRDDPEPDEALARYFALPDRDSAEAQRLENVVEAAIEGRIDAVLREQGVRGRFSLAGPLAVWPPVDAELARSPHVLVVAPRAVIERLRTELLRPDLPDEVAAEIEREVEALDESLSALVVPTGGFSVYPAVVNNHRDYRATVATAAHEWVHHYLAFYPLGNGVPRGDRLTINETVADLAGREIAALVLERFGDPTASDPAPAAPAPAEPPAPAEAPPSTHVDVSAVLRALRLEVDALLAGGRVEEAERRMEEVRQELAAAGTSLRRINQAYFAWYGTYAARADAVDPLGGQLRTLRERSGSLAAFLEAVRGQRARAGIERLVGD